MAARGRAGDRTSGHAGRALRRKQSSRLGFLRADHSKKKQEMKEEWMVDTKMQDYRPVMGQSCESEDRGCRLRMEVNW